MTCDQKTAKAPWEIREHRSLWDKLHPMPAGIFVTMLDWSTSKFAKAQLQIIRLPINHLFLMIIFQCAGIFRQFVNVSRIWTNIQRRAPQKFGSKIADHQSSTPKLRLMIGFNFDFFSDVGNGRRGNTERFDNPAYNRLERQIVAPRCMVAVPVIQRGYLGHEFRRAF